MVCDIKHEEKLAYLRQVNDAGVSNIEMECTALASLCRLTGVKCAVICVALLDRLEGDQVRGREGGREGGTPSLIRTTEITWTGLHMWF